MINTFVFIAIMCTSAVVAATVYSLNKKKTSKYCFESTSSNGLVDIDYALYSATFQRCASKDYLTPVTQQEAAILKKYRSAV